jgi:hypothetical protein
MMLSLDEMKKKKKISSNLSGRETKLTNYCGSFMQVIENQKSHSSRTINESETCTLDKGCSLQMSYHSPRRLTEGTNHHLSSSGCLCGTGRKYGQKW